MRYTTIGVIMLILVWGIHLYSQDQPEKTDIHQLKLGDKVLKEKTMEITAGKIHSLRDGKVISFEEMIRQMKDSRYVYVGETHNSQAMHDIQFQVAEALYEQDRNLSIGLEMFNIDWQEPLNKWSLGLLSREKFIDDAKWYVNWNFHFNYYKKIFDLAKDNKIPLYALNAPRDLIKKVRMMGWESLSEEDKKIVPQPDLTNADHLALMKEIFGQTEMPEAMKGHGDMMFRALYRAQATWDHVMAKNTLRASKVEDDRVVVMVGSGHLIYNLGINLRVSERDPAKFKTVVCVPVPAGEMRTVSRTLADFIWGIPEEERPVYPSDGLALKKFKGLENPVVEREPILGVAKGKNFKKGDVVLSVDGKKYTSINELRKYMSRFTWGDEVTFKLLRDASEIEVTLKYEETDESEEKLKGGENVR